MLLLGPLDALSLDALASHLSWAATHVAVWGPLLVFVFMAIESSLIPFPSEVVMIPAGFWAARGEFPPLGHPGAALALAILCGLLGSLAGAYANYYLARWAGRPLLHRYGRYVFLKPEALDRAEEIFREYGDLATFVCRLLPAIRQLISLPAGLARMDLGRFTLFTGLGAGIWTAILAAVGWWLGRTLVDASGQKLDYGILVHRGKDLIMEQFLWILLGLGMIVALWIWAHRRVMASKKKAI